MDKQLEYKKASADGGMTLHHMPMILSAKKSAACESLEDFLAEETLRLSLGAGGRIAEQREGERSAVRAVLRKSTHSPHILWLKLATWLRWLQGRLGESPAGRPLSSDSS